MNRHVFKLLACLLVSGVITGCSLKYAVDDPPAPGFSYQNVDPKPITIKVVDQRETVQFLVGISGLQGIDLSLTNVDDPSGLVFQGVSEGVYRTGSAAQACGQG